MLKSEEIEAIANGSGDIAKNLHDDIINAVLKRFIDRIIRLSKIEFSATDRWQLQTLQEAGFTLADIQKEIAKATRMQIKEIRKAMTKAGIQSLREDDEIYKLGGIESGTKFSAEMTRIIESQYRRTLALWNNYTGTTASQASDWFVEMCDRAYPLVVTGAMSYTEVIQNAIGQLSTQGIDVLYPTGHRDTIEVATLRAVRTAVAQTAGEITATRANENGIHLFLTSAHMGARPEHEVWQGKVFYVDWVKLSKAIPIQISDTEDDYDLKARYPDFVDTTKIGTVTGLCGVNCRHSYMPYIEGVSYNPFEGIDTEENNKAYEVSQRARAMERAIRRQKRALNGYETWKANDPTNPKAVAQYEKTLAKIREQTGRYYTFCRENKIKPSEIRLTI